jgi:cell shape-determining protein MreD
MAYLIAIPLLGALLLVQTAILSRAPLVQGTPDLLLLVILAWAIRPRVRSYWFWSLCAAVMFGYSSALGYPVPLISYGVATMLAFLLRRRVWRVLLLAYLAVVFVGTLLFQGLTVGILLAQGAALPAGDVVNRIILPSLVLNLFLALPVYVLVGDLAERLYPEELDVA